MSQTLQEIIVGVVVAAAVIWCVWRIFHKEPEKPFGCSSCPLRGGCKKDNC